MSVKINNVKKKCDEMVKYMIKFLFCDDEPAILDILYDKTVSAFLSLNCPAEGRKFSDPMKALALLDQAALDLLFLDIDMPTINGMDLAQRLLNLPENLRPLVVFVTQYDALVYQSFSCRPLGFIRKRFFDDEILSTLSLAISELSRRNSFFSFQTPDGTKRCRYDDILYFEADANYIRIRLAHEKDFIRFRKTMQSLSEELRNRGFIRIHKGFLVNQLHISLVRKEEIELDNHEVLPIGRINREQIRLSILKYLR